MSMIEIKNVSKWYGPVQVLNDCSVNIDKGDVVRFEGNVVMNLVMDTPAPPSQPEAEAEPEASNEEASPPPPTRSVKPHSSRKHGGTK